MCGPERTAAPPPRCHVSPSDGSHACRTPRACFALPPAPSPCPRGRCTRLSHPHVSCRAIFQVNLSVSGVVIMFLSELFESIRLVMTQLLLTGLRFHPSARRDRAGRRQGGGAVLDVSLRTVSPRSACSAPPCAPASPNNRRSRGAHVPCSRLHLLAAAGLAGAGIPAHGGRGGLWPHGALCALWPCRSTALLSAAGAWPARRRRRLCTAPCRARLLEASHEGPRLRCSQAERPGKFLLAAMMGFMVNSLAYIVIQVGSAVHRGGGW